MEKSTRICTLIAALALAGCKATVPVNPPKVPVQSEAQVALAAISPESLALCEGIDGDTPDNSTGSLLADYAKMAGALATCKARQHKLVEYLAPLVDKAKRTPELEK